MHTLGDLRLAVRGLRRSPLFTTVAILSLALGIGANSAIFTLIDQILLRKLPVRAPEELVMLYQRGSHNGSNMAVAGAPGAERRNQPAGHRRSVAVQPAGRTHPARPYRRFCRRIRCQLVLVVHRGG